MTTFFESSAKEQDAAPDTGDALMMQHTLILTQKII
jgi:hypothetical protein